MENVIDNLSRGKAAGLDGLTAEHLLNSHPVLPCILSRLFTVMIRTCYIPLDFCNSYTVPIPKSTDYIKALKCEDLEALQLAVCCLKFLSTVSLIVLTSIL